MEDTSSAATETGSDLSGNSDDAANEARSCAEVRTGVEASDGTTLGADCDVVGRCVRARGGPSGDTRALAGEERGGSTGPQARAATNSATAAGADAGGGGGACLELGFAGLLLGLCLGVGDGAGVEAGEEVALGVGGRRDVGDVGEGVHASGGSSSPGNISGGGDGVGYERMSDCEL